MSNIFKTNSRFAILAEDISTTIKETNQGNKNNNKKEDKLKIQENSMKDKNNSFKKTNDNDREERKQLSNRYINEQNERRLIEEKNIKQQAEKVKNEKLTESLSIDNFPELFSKIQIKESSSTYTSFLDKLNASVNTKKNKNNNDNDHVIDEEYENLKPGWMIIKKDLLTRQTKMKMKPYLTSLDVKPEKSQQEISYDVLNALCELHENRTKKYIELYGYDNWEKTFIFTNYDYEWVDKLDEQYEEEIKSKLVYIENEYEDNVW